MHVLVSIAAKWQCISLFVFVVHVTESIFLNIIINGLYTSEHYIVVAADSGGALKIAYEEDALGGLVVSVRVQTRPRTMDLN
jgi:hypothetical protein